MGFKLSGVSHAFDGVRLFENLDLAVAEGEIVCLVGPSGCGKTTLLRLTAGLERLQHGTIYFDDLEIASSVYHMPTERRGVGLMFQDFALFPHLNVENNIAFGLVHLSPADRERRISEVLDQVNLSARRRDYPHTLSGGQQQRVALARALAPEPKVMLLDEPFSGLDQNLRIQIREDTLGILKSSGAATLMVTHNPEEAMFMADRMMVMSGEGAVLQIGTPHEIYAEPVHPEVAAYFGQVNRLSGTVRGGKLTTPLGDFEVPEHDDGARLEVILRPSGVRLSTEDTEGVPVEILNSRPLGRNSFVRFRPKDGSAAEYHCRQPGFFPNDPGQKITAKIRPKHAFIFVTGK